MVFSFDFYICFVDSFLRCRLVVFFAAFGFGQTSLDESLGVVACVRRFICVCYAYDGRKTQHCCAHVQGTSNNFGCLFVLSLSPFAANNLTCGEITFSFFFSVNFNLI